jgi:hypothetical protein
LDLDLFSFWPPLAEATLLRVVVARQPAGSYQSWALAA